MTNITTTNFDISGDLRAKVADISYQVQAKCLGENCVPKDAELSFFINSGSNDIYFANRDLTLRTEKERYHWQGRQSWSNIRNSPPASGRFVFATLKMDTLRKVANAQKLSGSLAGHSFDWSYENRAPIRSLLAKMDSTAMKPE